MFVLVNYMPLFEFTCEVFDCIKLRKYFLPLLMVIMERSRSPLRPSPTVEGTRPLVNFPIWSRPMGYGATSQEQGQQVAQSMASQWNQGHSGVPATQEMPLSQGTVQIPGQSGASLECPNQQWPLRILGILLMDPNLYLLALELMEWAWLARCHLHHRGILIMLLQ